jgi:hypothetical protein
MVISATVVHPASYKVLSGLRLRAGSTCFEPRFKSLDPSLQLSQVRVIDRTSKVLSLEFGQVIHNQLAQKSVRSHPLLCREFQETIQRVWVAMNGEPSVTAFRRIELDQQLPVITFPAGQPLRGHPNGGSQCAQRRRTREGLPHFVPRHLGLCDAYLLGKFALAHDGPHARKRQPAGKFFM